MPASARMDLPDELWRRVFECQMDICSLPRPPGNGLNNLRTGPSNTSREALAYVKVCKRWKTLAEPFIYRNLHFSDPDALERAAHAMSRREEAEKILRWMHSLTLSPHVPNATLQACADYVASILGHGRKLVNLNTGAIPLTNAICAILAMVAVESLSTWELTFGPDGWAALARIGTFITLRSLTLHTSVDSDENRYSWTSMPLADADGWKLPELQFLSLTIGYLDDSSDHTEIFAFLGKCRLPRLERCHITAYSLDSPDDAPGLVEFLSAHPTLRYFQLFTDSTEVTNLGACMSQCTHLCVNPIPGNLGQALSSSLRVLTIHAADLDDFETKSLWPFLDELYTSRRVRSDLNRVQLDVPVPSEFYCHPFSWHTDQGIWDDEKSNPFLGKALSYALRLRERGIQLLDSEGYSMTLTKEELGQ